jgi:hypothetical protein|nr:MAG TPA: hypothetical protein [Caudoviricetes sp.]
MTLPFKISFIVNYDLDKNFLTPKATKEKLSKLEAYIHWMENSFDLKGNAQSCDIGSYDNEDYVSPSRETVYTLTSSVDSYAKSAALECFARGFALLLQHELSVKVEAEYIHSKGG